MSIYDRAKWPLPEMNPLVRLLEGGEEWIANHELADALGLVNTTRGNKSVSGHYKDVIAELGETETHLQKGFQRRGRQEVRVFSKKALVLVAMRARTINAAAFRDWLASRAAATGSSA